MGRITINGTQAGFSCKKEVSLALWDVKTNRAKGKSEEARTLNQELDNIKAQITRHYQYICDHDSFVTAKKVYNRYVGFSEECHTLMNLFREQLEPYKKKIGIEKAESTYCGLVADYKSLLLFMKSKKNAEDIVIEELEKSFIEDYYNWIEPRYKRQRAMRDMFLFMCFTGLSYVDLKAITYDNIHTDSDGGTWLMGNRIKTGVAYVVKLLPIAIELIEKYRGTDEKKDSPNVSFR